MGRKNNMQIKKSIMDEIDMDLNPKRLERMETFFSDLEGKINKVAELIDKVPVDSKVKPSKSFLDLFGL